VHFGGTGEVLTLTHETLSPSSYEAGIVLGLRAAVGTTGLVIGLDALMGLQANGAPPTADEASA
jgi:4-hydroxy-tetrahydrodipicolinate reductase